MESLTQNIVLNDITKIYRNPITLKNFYVLNNINLELAYGSFHILFGSEKSGKTTLLRIIAGLEKQTSGKISFCGENADNIPTYKRKFCYLHSTSTLIQNATVFNNISYSLKIKKAPAKIIDENVDQILNLIKLSDYKNKKVELLSEKQKICVLLAQALLAKPDAILFDNLLFNLNQEQKDLLAYAIKQVLKRFNIMGIYATSNYQEAMAIDEKIIVLNNNIIEQIGTVKQLYNFPKTEFVARSFGRCCIVKGKLLSVDGNYAVMNICGNILRIPYSFEMDIGSDYLAVIRPQNAILNDIEGFACKIVSSVFMGQYQNYTVLFGSALINFVEIITPNKRVYEKGEYCKIKIDTARIALIKEKN